MRIDGYTDRHEAHAEWVNDNVWVMSPEAFATFTTIVPVPEALIELGTLLVRPDLYSDDVWERFYAARWLVENYLRLLDEPNVEIDWDFTDCPETLEDELVDGEQVVY